MTELIIFLVIAIFAAWGWAIIKDDRADRKKELYRKAELAAEYRLKREDGLYQIGSAVKGLRIMGEIDKPKPVEAETQETIEQANKVAGATAQVARWQGGNNDKNSKS